MKHKLEFMSKGIHAQKKGDVVFSMERPGIDKVEKWDEETKGKLLLWTAMAQTTFDIFIEELKGAIN